jgi:hypothetical protein
MKVQISVTVNVDPEMWAAAYGVEGAAEIRADVKEHAATSIRDHFDSMGLVLR